MKLLNFLKEWYKGFLEDCPNGELSKEHLVEIYSQIFPGGNSEKFSEHVFGTFDTDRSRHASDVWLCCLFLFTRLRKVLGGVGLQHHQTSLSCLHRSGTIDFREFMLALHVTSCGTQEEKIRRGAKRGYWMGANATIITFNPGLF